MSDSLQPHGLQHARPPCPSPTPRAYTNSCPLSWWCHPTISPSVVPFSSRLQSFPASGSFQMSQLSTWGGQSVGVSASASVLPMNVQDWFASRWTGCISLQSKGLSRVFSWERSLSHSSKAPILQHSAFFTVQLRKVMTNLDSLLKSRDITLPTKVHLVKAMVFPVVMYRCESWTIKSLQSCPILYNPMD